MATNIGPKIGIDGEAEYRKQIQNIIQETKTLKSEYEKVSSTLDNGTTSLKKNKEMHKLLQEQIESQTRKIEEMKNMTQQAADKFGEADPKTQKWKESLNKAETELNNMKQDLKDLPSSVQVLTDKLEKSSDKLKGWGDDLKDLSNTLAPVSAAAAGILVGGAKSAIDYESAFTGVKKTVNATDEEFEELSDWIKEASTQMASSKTDIAGVMEIAGQLGITGVKDLEEFTKTMIMLGDTTNLSSDEAASALAKFTNITGESNKDISKIGSSIVDLGNNFATTEADIVAMSTRLASAGTIVGLTSTDILALATSMSSVGIEAEAGGTAMSQTLKAIATAVDSGGEDMERYAKISGMSAEEFSKTWKSSPIEAIEAFIRGLGRLNEEDESVIATLDDLGLTGIRQSNMLQALALSSDVLSDAVATSNQAYGENNALMAEAEKRYGTTESKIQQTKEKITNLAIEIGDRLLPYIDKGLDFMDRIKSAWDSLSPETQDMIIKVTAVVAVIGPAIGILGGLVTAISALMSPITLVVAGIGLLVAAGIAIYKNWDTIKEKAGELKDWVSEKWNGIKDSVTGAVDNIKTVNSRAWDAVKKKVEDNGGGIEGVIKTYAEGYAKIWEERFNKIDEITGGKLSEALKKVTTKLSAIKKDFIDTWDSIKKKVKEAIDFIKGLFDFEWSLPKIQLPHFSISGEFSLKPPRVPDISVEWYRKAMNNGIRMTSPTIFGMNGNKLMAGGEAGAEWVIGENSLLRMIQAAVGTSSNASSVNIGDTTIVINANAGQDVEEIAEAVDEIITARYQAMEAAWT